MANDELARHSEPTTFWRNKFNVALASATIGLVAFVSALTIISPDLITIMALALLLPLIGLIALLRASLSEKEGSSPTAITRPQIRCKWCEHMNDLDAVRCSHCAALLKSEELADMYR